MRKLLLGLFTIMLFITLGACGPAQPVVTVVVSPQPTNHETASYPAPQESIDPYPVTEQDHVETVVVGVDFNPDITPDPDLAVVTGTMLYNNKPVSGAILYLSGVIYSDAGDKWVSFDRNDTTRTLTNQQGEFSFFNVSPGEYGLVIDTIASSYLLHKPDGDEIIVVLSSGDTVNLGVLNYDDLPIEEPE